MGRRPARADRLPVAVIEGKVFEVYSEVVSGELKFTEVPMSRIYWRGGGGGRDLTIVDIVSRDALPDFVSERSARLHEWFTVFEAGLLKVRGVQMHGPRQPPEID